jgi:hypothetical protein
VGEELELEDDDDDEEEEEEPDLVRVGLLKEEEVVDVTRVPGLRVPAFSSSELVLVLSRETDFWMLAWA